MPRTLGQRALVALAGIPLCALALAGASVSAASTASAAPAAVAAPASVPGISRTWTAAPAAPAATASSSRSFSTSCTYHDPEGRQWSGRVRLTGRMVYTAHGGVRLTGARIRAVGMMATITSSRWYDLVNGRVDHGITGTLSPGESTGAWSPHTTATKHWGKWRVIGHRTDWPKARVVCSVDG